MTVPTRTADAWLEERLACPRDGARLRVDGERLTCPDGHEYPYVDGIPVLVVGDLAPTQPGYWAQPEQIEAARASRPPAWAASAAAYTGPAPASATDEASSAACRTPLP